MPCLFGSNSTRAKNYGKRHTSTIQSAYAYPQKIYTLMVKSIWFPGYSSTLAGVERVEDGDRIVFQCENRRLRGGIKEDVGRPGRQEVDHLGP